MRDFLKLSGRWLCTGWFWAFVLLALPNCGLPNIQLEDDGGCGQESCEPDDPPQDCEENPDCEDPTPPKEFDPGPSPQADAIYCDFPKPPGGSDCATTQDITDGASFASAAVALVQGQSYAIALDWSADAIAACGGPRKTEYLDGSFPAGSTVCFNCGAPHDSPAEACIAKCTDLINFGGGPVPSEGAAAFCAAHARISTNTEPDTCYGFACTSGGNPDPAYGDFRRRQESVTWSDFIGTDDLPSGVNNILQRTLPTTGAGDSDFNAGAASAQLITKGDAWVEFEAGETGLSHVIGLRVSCDNVLSCTDSDPGLTGIGFAISLNSDNSVYVLEAGTPLGVHGPFGLPYTAGERFRVRATDMNNGTATITYTRLAPGCMEGTVCSEELLYQSAALPSYPLRVDATFREQNATLVDVTLARIKQ